ncbi:alpha/beta hydrolase [Kribbella sp. NPDC023855]|uniref:alpha/beta fold hydrolase n=1 Tax=Kribbella sp. NPDC023855 TaxID=3154698 RepID=UPI0033CC4EDE
MGAVVVKRAVLAGGLGVPYGEVGGAEGTPVVFVHAYVESWRYFEVVLAQLPDSIHGFAPTQRGHGDADRPEDGYSLGDFAADIVEFMDAVGIPKAALVGTSSGGLVSQVVAGTYPDRVSQLVLISSPASLADKAVVDGMWAEISAMQDPLDRGFVADFVRSTSPGAMSDDFVERLVEESLKAPARVWKQTLRGLLDYDARADRDRITAPTLLICGDEDLFVRGDQQLLLEAISTARLKLYPGVGHGVHLVQPGHVVSDIVEFLAESG